MDTLYDQRGNGALDGNASVAYARNCYGRVEDVRESFKKKSKSKVRNISLGTKL